MSDSEPRTELTQLRDAVAAVRKLHWPHPGATDGVDLTCDCGDGLQSCPTIEALDKHLGSPTPQPTDDRPGTTS